MGELDRTTFTRLTAARAINGQRRHHHVQDDKLVLISFQFQQAVLPGMAVLGFYVFLQDALLDQRAELFIVVYYQNFVQVTMSNSSRQEAMEGEPVRRHVSDAVLKYDKPVYGMFIAVKIDTNTAETFRHGIWYTKDDVKQRLDIVPFTLAQFRQYFMAMFEAKQAKPEKVKELITVCESRRDVLEAPTWKDYISLSVQTCSENLRLSANAKKNA